MVYVDLAFRVNGTKLPVDHGYALYASLNRLIPALHESKEVGVHPIRGRYTGDGLLSLIPSSRLILRLPSESISTYLKLAGKALDVDGYRLRLGVPEVRALKPVATLYSRLVTIKGFLEPVTFLEAAKRKLEQEKIKAELTLGERRTFRVKDKQVVGFEVLATGSSAEDSIALQEKGLGGRRHLGCGVFVPHAVRGK
jgi:CRISPR-associated protein Cas6